MNSHSELFDIVKVAAANGTSLAISLSDAETSLSILVMGATLIYTVLKIRAHTCKRCRLGVEENRKPKG